LRAVTKELNKIKLERKKGKNIQKRAKKGKKTELTALSKELNKIKLEKKKGKDIQKKVKKERKQS
jgi:hypothetical protein